MPSEKRIGVLTSGGDCAGLNAVIRAVVSRAAEFGWSVIGIKEGTVGLLTRPLRYEVLTPEMLSGTVMRQGGTILGTTNKGNPFAYPMADGTLKDRSIEIIGGARELGLDALIGIGGDGSHAILRRLAQQGSINYVAIPKTIDNDVGLTEVSVGFDTAVAVATEALDRLQPTAASHARVMVLEVMGRDAGHIALSAGIAGGADVILLPEIPYSIEEVARKIRELRQAGRNFALVVVSEAVKAVGGSARHQEFLDGEKRFGGIGAEVAHRIAEATGAETRVTVLGHVQRGSMPSWRDRLIAAAFGAHAVDLIAEGKFDRMVAWSDRKVIDVPIEQAIAQSQAVELDGTLVRTARALGICLGD
jgi:6-phosphofructokinase 1